MRKQLRYFPFLIAVCCCLLGLAGMVWGVSMNRASEGVSSVGGQNVDLTPPAIDWLTAGPAHAVTLLPPGIVFERCATLAPGEALSYSFKADQAVVFDLHYHRGVLLSYARRKRTVALGAGTYPAFLSQDYCLAWHNIHRETIQLSWRYEVLPRTD